jgi:YidC/Oxa1 family membrane protein insertase
MEKNAIFAILLTGTIWLGWYMLFPPEQNKPDQTVQTQNQTKTETKQVKAVETKAIEPIVNVNAGKEENIEIKTSKFKLVLTNRGASIKSAIYTHKNDIANQKNIELVIEKSKTETSGVLDFAVHFDDNEFMNGGSLDTTLWNHIKTEDGIKFSAVINYNGNPLYIEKKYTFPKTGNEIKISYRFKNTGKNTIQFRDSSLIFSPGDSVGPTLDFSNSYNILSSTYQLNGSFKTETKGGGFFSKPPDLKKENGQVGWAGIMGRYFLLIMIPEGFTGSAILSNNKADKPGNRTGLSVKMDNLDSGKEITKNFKIYLGEKDKDALALVDNSIIEAADINSLIEPIRYAVIWSLMGINKYIGNIGWSLIIFSILTKLIFTPLTLKSTREMKRMSELTPKLNAMKAKYKDNPEVLNKKTMEFFKENKYNPMGGCLPMIVQMPFFIALYSALANSLDLWNAPFIFWMKDMSMPDTVAHIAGYTIQILPLIMVATTFIQQKLTSVDSGGQQQKIMLMVLPVVLLFAFWTMPSGLVLYWALQNIFQILQQVIANHIGKKTKAA